MHFDLLVVGASFAGIACAREAALKRGLRGAFEVGAPAKSRTEADGAG